LGIEGYTDSTGRPALNLTLSGQRADGVRTFLVSQGLNPGDVTSSGLGEADPVAANDTSAGRQQNRRVEIIVSREAIGTKIGDSGSVRPRHRSRATGESGFWVFNSCTFQRKASGDGVAWVFNFEQTESRCVSKLALRPKVQL
jgi:hypothetical protein